MKNKLFYLFFYISIIALSQHTNNEYIGKDSISTQVYTYKILEQVIKNEKKNNPDNLDSYQYYLYQKFFIDDYLFSHIDSTAGLETSKNELIFLGERVTEHKHDKYFGNKKVILADAVSGFKEPYYELFKESDFQEEFPSILKKKFHSYNFRLIDSTFINKRKSYIFSYAAKKKLLLNGKRGMLYIDSASFGVLKYSGEEYNQRYTRAFEYSWKHLNDIWYPVNQTNKIRFNAIDLSSFVPKEYQNKKIIIVPWIVIQNKIEDFTTQKMFTKKEFDRYTYELANGYNIDPINKISPYRIEPLNNREINTYKFSTLFDVLPIEKKIIQLQNLNKGLLPLGKIDLNLLNFTSYNDYEGFRFQLGGKTNYKLSPNYSLYGYMAFGTKNTNLKGSLGSEFYINKKQDGKLNVKLFADINPFTRNINRYAEGLNQIKEELNYIQNSIFYKYRGAEISYQQDFLKNITTTFATRYEIQKSDYDYSYKSYQPSYWFNQFTTDLNIKYAPFAEYMQTPKGKITIKDKPIYFYLNFTKAWKTLDSDFEYNKLNLLTDITLTNTLGISNIFVDAGYMSGNTPLWNMYGSFGDAKQGKTIWRRISSFGYHSFETLFPGSFFANKYTAIYLTHTLKNIDLLGLKKIDISFLYKGLIGNIDNIKIHTFPDKFQTPDKYYQELGMEFNKLIYYFGLGVYYRVGAYHVPNFDNNLFLKLTFTPF